ncbi:alpha/beta fold hydrolase [Ancylobacter vacuolatus]|uniref:alpha/beta fold hydrolase n=1 Tax=Ancylobacter vacuolatus TaxID=223389 RepID=UPI003522AA9D
MTTFVLIHGAWHGGWCWDRVAPLLEVAGHRVAAPTLSGLGGRQEVGATRIGTPRRVGRAN